MDKYFKITPLERGRTFVIHNISSDKKNGRKWVATQIIGSQVGFRNFDNPIKQQEVDEGLIYSDPEISGYQFDDEFDYIKSYDYWFDDSFSEEEQELLIEQYEGGTDDGIGAAWLYAGEHSWQLVGPEELCFRCAVQIDLIDKDGNILEENIQPI